MSGTTNIQDPPDKVKKVYDAVSKKFDVGTLDEFKTDMRDPKKNKKVYDVVSKDFDLGSYDNFQQDLGVNGKKKEETGGSPSPSGSSPNSGPIGQPINTSGSVPPSKQLTDNYKKNTISPNEVAHQNGALPGPSPEMVANAINNKGKNINNWQKAPSDRSSGYLVKEKQDVDGKIGEMDTQASRILAFKSGRLDEYDRDLNNLKSRRDYLTGEIGKSYNYQKQSLVPELTSQIKGLIDDSEFDPETHKLRPISVQFVAKKVDDIMNAKQDGVVNAQVSGDLDNKKRTYEDLTRSVVDQLNLIPIQKAQENFTKDFTKNNPQIKDAFDANKEAHEYFSKTNFDDIKASVNVQRDKSFINTDQRYFGENGVFNQNQDYIAIAHRYAERVHNGTMTDAVARKQIMSEVEQNPSLKKIKDTYDTEIRKINEDTQKKYQNYIISGLRREHPKLAVYKDGSVGLAGLSQDQYTNMMEGYEEGMDAIAKKMGGESTAAVLKQNNDKAKSQGAFWGSLSESTNELASAFSKFIFNKTQWGGHAVQNFEAQEIAAPNISESSVAAAWNWKGLESLKDPNFWLSKTGSMVPVIGGAAAVTFATEGEGVPHYISWLANAGLFTAQSGLSTYNQLLNSRDAQGNLISEADASRSMSDQMAKDFLPNVLMMAATSGTLLKAKNIIKPTLLGAAKKGLLGAAEAQPLFTWQGYNDYVTSQEAQGKQTDFWDYMQSKDFKDNLINGMVIGGGLSLLHAPGQYMKSVDNWTKMVHTSEGEFKNLIPQNYALSQEMAGNGNSLRDALKLHIFNTDPSTLDEAGKRQLADTENQLKYSVNLDKNIRTANLDRTSIKDLYQAHNLALADQHDYLSEQAAKDGNKSLSDVYKDKAKDYREQAKAAANGEAKYHYLVNDEGHPIFMSDKSFKTLEADGKIASWMKDGTIKEVVKSDDPEFSQRYKDFVGAKAEATVEGTDIMDHAAALVDQNKEKLGAYYFVAKENPEAFFKEVADQVYGRNADGSESLRPDAEKAAREQFGDGVVDLAKVLHPEEEKSAAPSEEITSVTQATEEVKATSKEEEGKIQPEDNITINEMLGVKGSYKGQRGIFVQDGQAVIFKVENSNREYELGNINEVGDRSVKDFGIDTEKSVVNIGDKGEITVREKPYVNPQKDPLKAIVRDEDGNVISVKLQTPNGEDRTFRGQVADDLAYEITLKKISDNNEQPALEQFINEDPAAREEINNAGLAAASEEQATGDNQPVQREKIEPVTNSSPIKSESDEKANEAKGRQGDVLTTPEEGGAKQNLMDGDTPPSPPKPPEVRTPVESPKDEFTAVRKEKQKEIKGAKKLFERQKVIKWTETYDNALKNVQAMYPDKGLYNAMKSRIGEFLAKLDAGQLFNPTSEDIAVFNVYKNETMRRMNEIRGWDSEDNIQRLAAAAEFNVLQNDLFNVVKVTNPGGEAGRAFNLLQSEVAQDPEYGLKIRRMELLGAKVGGKLTQADLDFTADNWERERALMEKSQELKEKGMQEKFDKEMARIKADYDKKLKSVREEKKPSSQKEKREKLLKEKGAELAAKIRSGKLKGTYATIPGFPQAVNLVIESIAKLVEGGYTLAQAIDEYVQANKIKNKDQFQNDLFEVFEKQEKQGDTFDKIKILAESEGLTDVNKDMVGKNLIRDYVNSHVGLHDTKDVLDVVHDRLKEILPDLEKDRLREAYLKQGDFKQPTKKELETGFKQAQKNFDRMTALDKDIADLNNKKELFKKSSNKPYPYDKDIESKEKERKGIMDAMGIKSSGEDKYKKASYDQRAKAHNDRIDDIGKSIQEKIDNGGLSDKSEKALIKLKNLLEGATITIDPTSALSQERTLDGGLALLKSIKSEFQRSAMDDVAKIGDINRSLQKAIDKFGSDKDESEQDVKLQRAKDKAKRDAENFFSKITRGEYEDKPITELTKTDAELIRLERDRSALSQLYQKKRSEYEKANKSNFKRWANLARGAMVTSLIWKPFTLAKVATSALLRPAFEAVTKLTFGKGFEALPFETTKAISEKASEGGEGQSIKSIKKGYEAYLRQYSPEQLEKLYTSSNDKYEKASKEYVDQQAEVNRVKYMGMDKPEYKQAVDRLNELKGKRDEALVDAVGNSIYQYIAGSSMKEALEVLLHRSTTMERQFGDFETEGWAKGNGDKKLLTAADNLGYLMNFVGRSHATLKNFSARFSFATGFMARLESAVKNDVDISNPDKILEVAHASYLDWERGKYQEGNWVSDAWNKATTAVENIGSEGSRIRQFGEGMAYIMRSDVAITRVPVNMLREGILEYTLGAFTSSVKAAREYYKAKGIVLQDGMTEKGTQEFKQELREQLNKMDPEKAAAIVRAFRKGGFGLGLYSLALLGHVAFGGWAHKGQTAEDAKKAKRDQDDGLDEIKTGEIRIGDWKMPEVFAKIAEHTPAFTPLGFGLGLAQVYGNGIKDGKSTIQSATESALAQVNHVTGSIPQIDKVLLPLAAGAAKQVLPSGQWDDVDQDGNPMKRKAFEMSDYLNYLPGFGDKKEILSEAYYKQAVNAKKQYREAVTEIEINTSLSKEDKEQQRKEKLEELDSAIADIYKQNKEDPQ